MKILHLSAVRDWGGGGNHLESLCTELPKLDPDVENVILVGRGGQFHKRLKQSSFRYETLPLLFNLDPRALWKIISLCKREAFDLIHIHGATSIALAVIADHFYPLPPFVFSKKTSFPIRTRRRTLYKYSYKKIRKVLCVSEVTRRMVLQSLPKSSHLEVIYHGTRIDNKSDQTPFTLRSKLKISPEKVIIGNIANHMKAKDLETFIRMADYLIHTKGATELHFVQIGKFRRITKDLRALVQRLGLEPHFHFLGFLPDAANFIPQFDVLVVSSESEGIPQVIYEAFYHEVPVVSTMAGGIEEVVSHKENGLLAPVHAPEELGKNLLFLLKNPELIPTFTKISKNKLHRLYTSEIMARKTLCAYKQVLDGII